MKTQFTNIGTEINGTWMYLAVVDGKLALADANNEVIEMADASENIWYFTTEQLDKFEAECDFSIEC